MFDSIFKKTQALIQPATPAVKSGWESGTSAPEPKTEVKPNQPVTAGKVVKPKKNKYFVLVIIGLIAAIVFGQWWLFVFKPDQSELSISGPTLVKAGERVEFAVVLANKNKKQELKDLSFTFRADDGAEFIDAEALGLYQSHVNSLAPMGQEKQDLKAVFWGKQGDERTIEVIARYRVGDNANRFEKTQLVQVMISDAAVQLVISLPQQAITDQEFRSSVEYRKLTPNEWRRGRLLIEAPEKFSLTRTDPELKSIGSLIWPWEDLEKQENSKVIFDGLVASSEGQVKEFKARFFVAVRGHEVLVAEVSEELSVVSNPLALALTVSEDPSYAHKQGDLVHWRLSFKNNYDIALKDVVIQADPNDPWLEPGSLKIDNGGFYSSRDKLIVWNGGATPQLLVLNPRESGTVSFRGKLLSGYQGNLSQSVMTIRAVISTQTRPVDVGTNIQTEAVLETKIQGLLEIVPRLVFRDDPQTGFANIGAIPLRVNQANQYTLYLTARAVANPFENISWKTVLPANISFDGKTKGEAAGLVYNPRTGEMTWAIEKLEAYNSKTIALQLTAIPSNDQIGKLIMICDEMTATATDSFTRSEVKVTSGKIMSDLPDDDSIDANTGRVSL